MVSLQSFDISFLGIDLWRVLCPAIIVAAIYYLFRGFSLQASLFVGLELALALVLVELLFTQIKLPGILQSLADSLGQEALAALIFICIRFAAGYWESGVFEPDALKSVETFIIAFISVMVGDTIHTALFSMEINKNAAASIENSKNKKKKKKSSNPLPPERQDNSVNQQMNVLRGESLDGMIL